MSDTDDLSKYLPLSETTFYTMICLVEPMHGYALMQKAEQISQGCIKIGAGTLYTIFSTLEKEALIEMVSEGDRRKVYRLTAKGRQVLLRQIHRVDVMAQNGRSVLKSLREESQR